MRAGLRQSPDQQGWGLLSPGHARVPEVARTPPATGHGPHAGAVWPCWSGSSSCGALWFDSGCSHPRGVSTARGHWVWMRSSRAEHKRGASIQAAGEEASGGTRVWGGSSCDSHLSTSVQCVQERVSLPNLDSGLWEHRGHSA